MFDQVIESMRKATEATVLMQQEMFKKWFALWPMPGAPPAWEQAQQFQKKWAETFTELLKRQHDITEAQFKAGLQNIEKSFHFAEAKSPEELRTKTAELWKQCFESLRQASESQMREFQVVTEKWFELMSRNVT
jgi:predicted RNase H-like HicB family nuclease